MGERNARPRSARTQGQLALPGSAPRLPAGLRYQADLLAAEEERALVAHLEPLPFKAFEFKGYVGRRRVVSFGWEYDFASETLRETREMPPFLAPVRDKAAAFAGIDPGDMQHVLVTEYGPGAAIGWHRDKGVFGKVVGVSLLSACVLRLRRKAGTKWERASFVAEPRSAYLLDGPSRTEWQHSIPPVDALLYSLTFRNLRRR